MLFAVILLFFGAISVSHSIDCYSHTYASYRVKFRGLWSKDRFPKVYPETRPKAEWKSMVGRSHSPSYNLFSIGEFASNKLKHYAEHGDMNAIHAEGQDGHSILDSFTATPIQTGDGESTAIFLASTNHSQVSLVVKIEPSPDWFVGIDSLSLCQHGHWLENHDIDLWPLDCGTQRGYTFSSPRWRSDPVESISMITNVYPNHTADAFFYPHLSSLPYIARVSLSLITTFNIWRFLLLGQGVDSLHSTPVSKTHSLIKPPIPKSIRTGSGTFIMQDPFSRHTSVTLPPAPVTWKTSSLARTTSSTLRLSSTASSTSHTTLKSTKNPWTTSTIPADSQSWDDNSESGSADMNLDIDDEDYSNVEGSGLYGTENTKLAELKGTEMTTLTVLDITNDTLSVDDVTEVENERVCLVSEWSEWSTCSQTCGYGVKTRNRSVLHWTRDVNCPELKVELLCGSMKKCNWSHFSLTFNSTRSIINPQLKRRQKNMKRKIKSKPALHAMRIRRRQRV